MARIRSIKIGFFTNEDLAKLSPWHRLLFAGLWVIADKAGRLEDRPARIKAQLFPYDDLRVDEALGELAAAGFIERYRVRGAAYIAISAFLDHQKPHHKEPESAIPGPPKRRVSTAQASVMHDSSMAPDEGASPEKDRPDPVVFGSLSLGSGLGNGDGSGGGEPPAPRKPVLAVRSGGLTGRCQMHHPATWPACGRGSCVPPFIVEEWQRTCASTGWNPDDSIRAVVRAAVASVPEDASFAPPDPAKFWRGWWAQVHGGAQTPVAVGRESVTAHTMRVAREVLEDIS